MSEDEQPTPVVQRVDNPSEAAAVVQVMRDLHVPQVVTVNPAGELTGDSKAGVLCVPQGMRVVDLLPFLDRRLPAPRRTSGTAELDDLESFIAHARRFAVDPARAVIFASSNDGRTEASLETVLDYDGPDAPRFRAHRGRYDLRFSDEWKAWIHVAGGGRTFTQQAFAEFLEDHILDVIDPTRLGADSPTRQTAEAIGAKLGTPNALLTLSRGLAVNVDVKVKQAVSLATGEARVAYDETHTSTHNADRGGTVEVPGAFAIAIPVFRHGAAYTIPVRLRYRVNAGTITWSLAPYRADAAFDQAFDEACKVASSQTGLPVWRGTSEANLDAEGDA